MGRRARDQRIYFLILRFLTNKDIVKREIELLSNQHPLLDPFKVIEEINSAESKTHSWKLATSFNAADQFRGTQLDIGQSYRLNISIDR